MLLNTDKPVFTDGAITADIAATNRTSSVRFANCDFSFAFSTMFFVLFIDSNELEIPSTMPDKISVRPPPFSIYI